MIWKKRPTETDIAALSSNYTALNNSTVKTLFYTAESGTNNIATLERNSNYFFVMSSNVGYGLWVIQTNLSAIVAINKLAGNVNVEITYNSENPLMLQVVNNTSYSLGCRIITLGAT